MADIPRKEEHQNEGRTRPLEFPLAKGGFDPEQEKVKIGSLQSPPTLPIRRRPYMLLRATLSADLR